MGVVAALTMVLRLSFFLCFSDSGMGRGEYLREVWDSFLLEREGHVDKKSHRCSAGEPNMKSEVYYIYRPLSGGAMMSEVYHIYV